MDQRHQSFWTSVDHFGPSHRAKKKDLRPKLFLKTPYLTISLWIYTATAWPKVIYGSLVWAHSLDKTLGNKLKQMQRKILVAISGALRSIPTDAMEVIAGLILLDLHTMELAARSRVRTKPLVKDRWDGIDGSQRGPGKVVGHWRYWDKFTEEIGELEKPFQRENSWIKWESLEGEAELTSRGVQTFC